MDTFLLQWGKSSQMRKWLSEQKKELGNRYGDEQEFDGKVRELVRGVVLKTVSERGCSRRCRSTCSR